MEVNPFLKRMMKASKEDIFHSSAYGAAQNGSGMGAASASSFSDRAKIEGNRKIIKGYGSSAISRSTISNGPRAKACAPPTNGGGAGPKGFPPRNPGISR